MGAMEGEVRRRLGNPARQLDRKGYRCLLYKSIRGNDQDGAVLRNTYIFKHGKLIELAVHLDSLPGCGSDSRSDKGWPWTRL